MRPWVGVLEEWVGQRSRLQTLLMAAVLLAVVAVLDLVTSVEIIFGFFYLAPIFLIAWKFGTRGGLVMALLCAVIWSGLDHIEHPAVAIGAKLWNLAVQFMLFAAFASALAATRSTGLALRKSNRELQQALSEVKRLSGLLPICAWCKKIRDTDGTWHLLEQYLMEHADVDFTHSICPDCQEHHLQELRRLKESGQSGEISP